MANLTADILPANAADMNPVSGTQWGIDCTYTNFIIQSVDYTEEPVRD